MGWTRVYDIRYLDIVMYSCWSISRETLHSSYTWDSEVGGKRELAGVGDNVE